MTVPWNRLIEEALDMGLEPSAALLAVLGAGLRIEEKELGEAAMRRKSRAYYMRSYRAARTAERHRQRLAAA